MGPGPNEYTLESDPKRVQIADPNEYGSGRSSVNGKPICDRNDKDPFGSVVVYPGPYFYIFPFT